MSTSSSTATDLNNVTRMIMDQLIIQKFGDVLGNKFKLTFKNIGKILLILSAPDIKKLLEDMFLLLKEYVKSSPEYLKRIVQYISNIRFRKVIVREQQQKPVKYPYVFSVTMTPDSNFLTSLYHLIEKTSPNKINITDIKIVSNETVRTEIIESFKFKIYIPQKLDESAIEVNVAIKNKLTFEINPKANIYKMLNSAHDNDSVVNIIKHPELKKLVKDALDYCRLNEKPNIEFYQNKFKNEFKSKKITEMNYVAYEYSIALLLKIMYPMYDIIDLMIITVIIAKFNYVINNSLYSNNCLFGYFVQSIISGYEYGILNINKFLNIPSEIYAWIQNAGTILNYSNFMINFCKSVNIHSRINVSVFYDSKIAVSSWTTVSEDTLVSDIIKNNEEKRSVNNGNIKFQLKSSTLFSDKLAMDMLIKKVNESYEKTGTKVDVYMLQIQKDEIEKKKENPEYKKYKDKVKALQNMFTNNDQVNVKSDDANSVVVPTVKSTNYILEKQLSNMNIPEEFITHIEMTKKPSLKHLNKIEKSIDTLHLRQNDIEVLLQTLERFKNNKEIFRTYGIPYKMNILLHGEPGTGKTSTIQAIASFMQRNIYYLDLKQCETNDDIQMLFDHVFKEMIQPGIIILEEIDKMTPVVLKNHTFNTEHISTNDLINSVKKGVTLEFLLNILQGLLTHDNTMVIATTNHLDAIEPAFYRVGRFDVNIDFKKCDHYQIRSIFKRIIKRDLCEDVLTKIPENAFTPGEVIFHLVPLSSLPLSDLEYMSKFI